MAVGMNAAADAEVAADVKSTVPEESPVLVSTLPVGATWAELVVVVIAAGSVVAVAVDVATTVDGSFCLVNCSSTIM